MQAQQNMASSTTSDVDTRRLRMLLNNRNMALGRDGKTNSVGDIIPNIGSPGQSGGSRTDIDMLIKVCPMTFFYLANGNFLLLIQNVGFSL